MSTYTKVLEHALPLYAKSQTTKGRAAELAFPLMVSLMSYGFVDVLANIR